MAYIDDAARVAESSTTTGTGDFSLAAAYDASYGRFSAVCSVGDTVPYTIVADDGKWEHGLGTYSAANTLTRTTVKQNSLGNTSLVTFAAGSKIVFLGNPGMARSIDAAAAKATPVDADKVGYWDSVSGLLRSMTWANIKTALNSATATLTNKWVQPRVGTSSANSATPSINTDSYDVFRITGQSATITSMSTNLTGTPVDSQPLIIEITGTGAVGITWGASFVGSTIALPTTTVGTNKLSCAFLWDSVQTKWRLVGTC